MTILVKRVSKNCHLKQLQVSKKIENARHFAIV
ncbi:MAG: hypothetical protein KJP23_25115 [Deltaproteobacteria bacterium]|nr:hypothetical protein [Deltaproteobacteria bacterium]